MRKGAGGPINTRKERRTRDAVRHDSSDAVRRRTARQAEKRYARSTVRRPRAEATAQPAKKRGMSVIFISSEMDEMVRTCTKLIVMRDRRKVAELENDEISSENVMKAIAGGAA